MACTHLYITDPLQRPQPFMGPVNHREPNRAAHGGVRKTQECVRCGSFRHILINGIHREYGPWRSK